MTMPQPDDQWIKPCQDGGYWAQLPELPGCFVQAHSVELLKWKAGDMTAEYPGILRRNPRPERTTERKLPSRFMPHEIVAVLVQMGCWQVAAITRFSWLWNSETNTWVCLCLEEPLVQAEVLKAILEHTGISEEEFKKRVVIDKRFRWFEKWQTN